MSNEMLAALAEIGVFRSLHPQDRQMTASLLKPKSFSANETIFMEGEEGRGMYLIRSGKVKICVNDEQGNELIFTFLSAGDLLGEIAILDGGPRSASAIAITHTNTLYIDRREFMEFLKTSPRVCISIIATLCKTLRRVSIRLEEFSFLDISGRIARNLLTMSARSPVDRFHKGQLICSISQEELANVVGASRVMVNKILNSFVDLGLISMARKKITVLNEYELNRIGNYNWNKYPGIIASSTGKI